MFLWHAVHDGYLGNAPPGRLQVYGFLDQQCQQRWPKTSVRERRFSRHENQTDPDVRFGWFEHKGFTALMPKPTCRVWIRIPLPKSFVATGSSTPVPSGNGGEENCISVRATAHVEAHLNQTGGLQGLCNVSCDDLADNDLGAGSGWQQSRQNWMAPAVMRY